MWFVRARSMEAMGVQAPSLGQKRQAWVVDHVSFWDPREPPGAGQGHGSGWAPAKSSHPSTSLARKSKEKALLGRRGWPKARACITAPCLVPGEMLDPPHQHLPVT